MGATGTVAGGGALFICSELWTLELSCDSIPERDYVPFLPTSHLASDWIPSAVCLTVLGREALFQKLKQLPQYKYYEVQMHLL